MNKAEQQNVKPTLNVSVSITFIRTLISRELFTQRGMLVEILRANKISTSIHRCVKIFLISKSWWRLVKPKRLNLTLHHNKFISLDYSVFSAFFMLLDLDPYLLLYRLFGKKYQIHSYTTSNMDDFKTICIYENLPIFAYFFKSREDFSCLLKKSNNFKYHSTCQRRT